LAKNVADSITDKAEIHRAITSGSKQLNKTYYEEGVMLWIIEDVIARDPEAGKVAEELIKDMGFRRAGSGYAISCEDAAKNMGFSIDEAHEVLSSLQAESVLPDWASKTGPIQ